ncbi:uncharacterized protein LOC116413809 [Galleria mellonella]|uniref:Uncharacterized protein LOC116413809 n=1 Tax=Galleria mellonella TaxID=7137 RepID=A0ABM3MAP6_GALME|nr:uncharacterized protein LOC116413809 [Galleria mellonella]
MCPIFSDIAKLCIDKVISHNAQYIKGTTCKPQRKKNKAYQVEMITLLSTIKNQNEQISELLKETAQPENYRHEFQFPIKNDDELNAIELVLRNEPGKYINLFKYIRSVGGRHLANRVSRVLKILMLDTMASKYNYFGKGSKRAFSTLLLGKCVIEAIASSTPDVTVKQVEDQIKIWLKHAPERARKQAASNYL